MSQVSSLLQIDCPGLHHLCVTAPVLAPLSEIIQPSTVMPEYNHGHIGIPAQLLSKNDMPPKTLQHDAVTPVVQAHTFTAAVWE